ncbi:hypothetical protein M0638_25335 [Roseomonas sp. NAR14]|uniref:Uncharacterized protein n=1 Tax=Roseomonas acroporae TaxID=2937791 RepID=A0A9X2BZ60_9PROT|nr:hypothetical protein [Roseomonas acroporae]MCK8787694.1 hypothetical protein [Roseomonas acroporae]
MRGSPRSLWLSMANRWVATGAALYAAAARTVVRQQQKSVLSAMTPKPTRRKRSRKH